MKPVVKMRTSMGKGVRGWGVVFLSVMVFAPSPQAFASQVDCAVLVAEEADPEPLPPGEYLLRVHPALKLHEVLVIEQYPIDGGGVTRRFRRQVRSGTAGPNLGAQEPRGADWHFAQVRHIAREVKQVYVDRDRFTPEFRDDYVEDSRLYINDTEYVEVRDQNGNFVAGNRYIFAPYALDQGERVPRGPVVKEFYGAEFDRFREPDEIQPDDELPRPVRRLSSAHYLGDLDLPVYTWTPSGSKFPCALEVEMGAYVVKQVGTREQQEIWKAELWVQLLLTAHNERFDDAFNYNALVIYSFSDLKGRRMYEPLGFKSLTDDPVIAQDGAPWWPLIYFLHALDSASMRAAGGTGAWMRSGEYFRERLGKSNKNKEEHGPLVLPLYESILRSLESENRDEMILASHTLLRLSRLLAMHYKVANQTPSEPRAGLALKSVDTLLPVFKAFENGLLKLIQSPNVAIRRRISDMLDALIQHSASRPYLSKKILLAEFICTQLVDSDPRLLINTGYWLRNNYTYAEIVDLLGESQTEQRVLDALRSAGLSDRLINEMVAVIHEAMTAPLFIVHPENPDLSYQSSTFLADLGPSISRVANGNKGIARDLLLLTALRNSSMAAALDSRP